MLLPQSAVLRRSQCQPESLKTKALADIEREKTAAREEMKQAIVDVAFEAAKQIVDKEIDEQAHKRYVDDLSRIPLPHFAFFVPSQFSDALKFEKTSDDVD